MLGLFGVVTAAMCASCAQQQVPMELGSTFGVASAVSGRTRARGAGADGYDLIRIVADTSVRASKSAVGILKSLPQVEEASIERASARLSLRRASDGTAWRQVKQSAVPAIAPDSVPFSAISRLFYPANGSWPYAQDVLMLRFRPGTPVAERSRVIGLVSGTVVGGKRDVTAEGGVYVIGLPRDSTQATLLAARGRLRSENAVLTVWLYEFAPVDPTNVKREATLADRQAAVAAVGGVVIGGARLLGTDGYYSIRLLSDTSVRAPFKAVTLLRGLAQIEEANVEWVSARLQH